MGRFFGPCFVLIATVFSGIQMPAFSRESCTWSWCLCHLFIEAVLIGVCTKDLLYAVSIC